MANADRVEFALRFADKTGLHPTTVYSWTMFENDDVHQARRPHNWLNWKLDADIQDIPYVTLDPASDGGSFPGYSSLDLALQAGLKRFSSDRYAGIRATAGQSLEDQLAAIRASDWGTKSLSRVNFVQDDLYWPWVSWYLGEGYWKQYGKRYQPRRPDVFPRPIPLTWWAKLALFLAKRKLS